MKLMAASSNRCHLQPDPRVNQTKLHAPHILYVRVAFRDRRMGAFFVPQSSHLIYVTSNCSGCNFHLNLGGKIPPPIFLAVIAAFTATVTLYDTTHREVGSFFFFFFYNRTGQKGCRSMLGKYIHAAHLTANKPRCVFNYELLYGISCLWAESMPELRRIADCKFVSVTHHFKIPPFMKSSPACKPPPPPRQNTPEGFAFAWEITG